MYVEATNSIDIHFNGKLASVGNPILVYFLSGFLLDDVCESDQLPHRWMCNDPINNCNHWPMNDVAK